MASTPDPKPLTPKVFHILLALARETKNGYQLALDVEGASHGAIRLSPATLYENLARLAEKGLIREASVTGLPDGRGQRYWELTPGGLDRLRTEVDRLRSDLRAAEAVPALGEG